MLQEAAISRGFRWSRREPVATACPAATVARVLDAPDEKLDYLTAKLAFDAIVDPLFDEIQVAGEIDRLFEAARELAGNNSRPPLRLAAVRRVLYESGPWNDHRPFAYDHSDPLGISLSGKLLHNYLRTRLGQCVSMPALFLILAERLRLDVALSPAPEHVFVRYTDAEGRVHNLEATSGGHPARDAWLREKFCISAQAIETGIYLRTLTKREGIALLASTVIEHLAASERDVEAMDVSALVLRHSPRDTHALLSLGGAAGKLLDKLRAMYRSERDMPAAVRLKAFELMQCNARCFARAAKLGWIEPDQGGDDVRMPS